jgi:hypothetical protein
MADYLKLFHDRRLSPSEPHHLDFIKGRLANLKIEEPKAYEDFAAFYGVSIEAKVTKVPEAKKAEKKALKIK